MFLYEIKFYRFPLHKHSLNVLYHFDYGKLIIRTINRKVRFDNYDLSDYKIYLHSHRNNYRASTAFILYHTLKTKSKNPDRILEEVKSYFMDIKGSYILHEPLQNKEQYLNRFVYQGGITQNKTTVI